MYEFLNNIQRVNKIKTKSEVKVMQPLVLAYVGDAVFELFIRHYLINKGAGHVDEYHKESIRYVSANAQSKIIHSLKPVFTDEEWIIIKRGRNQNSATIPKNVNIIDYKYATGFEALLGYLFYTGDYKRLITVMNKAAETIENSRTELRDI